MTEIYVGNLAYSVEEDELRSFFDPSCGAVTTVKIIKDRETGRSKGYGFVGFENAADAEKAVNEKNGAMFNERTIKVNMSKGRADAGRGSRSTQY